MGVPTILDRHTVGDYIYGPLLNLEITSCALWTAAARAAPPRRRAILSRSRRPPSGPCLHVEHAGRIKNTRSVCRRGDEHQVLFFLKKGGNSSKYLQLAGWWQCRCFLRLDQSVSKPPPTQLPTNQTFHILLYRWQCRKSKPVCD